MTTLTYYLNKLAGTTGLAEAGAANAFAGTTGKATQGALNAYLGTSGLGTAECLNRLAGTKGLGVAGAASMAIPRTSMVAWYDAFNVNGYGVAQPANAAAIGTWKDLSGNGRDATQGTGGLQPSFLTSGITTRPSVSFSAHSINSTIPALSITTLSIYAVVANSTVNATNQRIAATTATAFALVQAATTGRFQGFFNASVPDATGTNGSPAAGTVLAGTTTATDGFLMVDGVDFTTTTDPAGTTGTALTLGAANAAAANPFVGRISAVVLYSATHTAAQRLVVSRALGRRYGITVA